MVKWDSGRPAWQVAGVGVAGFVALLWGLEGIDVLADHELDGWGIRPRTDEGLLGILAAPLLHGGWDHLGANTIPALVLGFLALVTGLARGLAATAIIWLLGGLAVWLLAGSNTEHIGASGLVFGWLVYLVLRGFFARNAAQRVPRLRAQTQREPGETQRNADGRRGTTSLPPSCAQANGGGDPIRVPTSAVP